MPLEYRSDLLRRSLASLHRAAPDIRGSAVITNDGFIIAAYPPGWDENIHDPMGGENVAATAAVVSSTIERTLNRLAQGEIERVLMEGANGSIGILPITPDSTLAVLIEKNAKLGLTLQASRQAVVDLRAVLKKD